MQFGVDYRTPWTVLDLNGPLDLDASPGVYLRFQRELLRGNTHVLFDLSGVDIVDSHGLGVLVRCYKDARRRGGEVGLKRVPPPIGRILEFTRLDSIFRQALGDEPPADGPNSEAA
jgi:anti-anti-sigma factor